MNTEGSDPWLNLIKFCYLTKEISRSRIATLWALQVVAVRCLEYCGVMQSNLNLDLLKWLLGSGNLVFLLAYMVCIVSDWQLVLFFLVTTVPLNLWTFIQNDLWMIEGQGFFCHLNCMDLFCKLVLCVV